MLIGEVIRTAFASLRSNTLRSLLTMLGIIIGVAAVIAMIALGNGAAGAVKDRIARLGTTTLQINPQRVMQGGIGTTATAKLTYDDVKSIEAHALSVVGVTPQQDRNLQVVWKSKNTNVQVTGTTPNFLDVRGFTLGDGAMFTSADNQGRQRVAVLGADVLPLLDVADPTGGHRRDDSHLRTTVQSHRRARAQGHHRLRRQRRANSHSLPHRPLRHLRHGPDQRHLGPRRRAGDR